MKLLNNPQDPLWAILINVAEPVSDIDSQVRPFLAGMYALARKSKAFSLGAQQVGIGRRFFIWGGGQINRAGVYQAIINPEIVHRSATQITGSEHCLSYPGITHEVERPWHINVNWTDLYGHPQNKTFWDLNARIFCHEIDRMDAIRPHLTNSQPDPKQK